MSGSRDRLGSGTVFFTFSVFAFLFGFHHIAPGFIFKGINIVHEAFSEWNIFLAGV
jgi:hypothetical protein